ncbi:arginine--tRNA ligase, chloroplastic/mitochondrial [Tanacetum coccineum]
MAHLAQLARDANSNQLKNMLLVFFEKENYSDFVLSRQMSQMARQYTHRVAQRAFMTTSTPTVPRSKISMLKDRVIIDFNSRIFKLEAIIQVLVHKTNGGVVDKLEFSEDFPNLSTEFCDELNKEVLKLFESCNCSSGSGCSDLDIDDVANEVSNLRAGSRLDGIRDTYTATGAAKLEGWILNDRQKTPRASYVGYQSCNTEVNEFLLEIAKRRYEAVLKDIIELKKASELILEKDAGWEKGEERMLGFHLLEFTEVLEESRLSVLPHILCEYLYDLAKKFNSYHFSMYEIFTIDKFGLWGSHFSEPDYAHVSLFNEDWPNPIRINDQGLVYTGNPNSGHPVSFSQFIDICLELYIVTDKKNDGYQVGDHKEEIDLSEFWDKKLDGLCSCLSIGGDNRHTCLYYMLLRDAIDTTLEIKFTTKTDGFACEVHGYIVAHYRDVFLYESQSETDTICKDSYMALLFRPEPPYVLTDGIILLIKSVLAVPTKGSLIVKAYMEDAKSDKVIMDGCCKFKPLLEYGCISGTIARRDGCSLDLRDESVAETSTLLLYAATDVVMDKCFDLLGISPGIVLEKLCDRLEITLDKKSDALCGCLSVGGDNGHTRLYYMLLRDVIDTALEIKFTTKMDGFACEVRGYIASHYRDDFLYES